MHGDVYLLYRCQRCDNVHAHHVAPLDEGRAALDVALATAWIFERAEGARDCGFLVATGVGGRPVALAVRRDGDTLTGAALELDITTAKGLDAPGAYARAAREGRALPTERADAAGFARLLDGALTGARSAQLTLERLLAEVDMRDFD